MKNQPTTETNCVDFKKIFSKNPEVQEVSSGTKTRIKRCAIPQDATGDTTRIEIYVDVFQLAVLEHKPKALAILLDMAR
jgi:hypothetical protein